MIARGGGVLPVAVELVMQVRNLPTLFPLALALAGCVAGAPTGATTGGGTPNGGAQRRKRRQQHGRQRRVFRHGHRAAARRASHRQRHPRMSGRRAARPAPPAPADPGGIRRHGRRPAVRAPAAAVDNLPVESVVDGFNNHATAQVVTSRHLDEFLATGERLVTQALAQNKGRLVTCAGAPGCDRMFISSFGRRAFRRPLSADEVQRYLALFAPSITGNSFDKGMELAMRAMLSSPHFLYRSEVGERAPDGSCKLTPYELATAMSYLSDRHHARRRAAGRRRHRRRSPRPRASRPRPRRLLQDPRSRPALAAFFRQWLGIDGFLFTNKDAADLPDLHRRHPQGHGRGARRLPGPRGAGQRQRGRHRQVRGAVQRRLRVRQRRPGALLRPSPAPATPALRPPACRHRADAQAGRGADAGRACWARTPTATSPRPVRRGVFVRPQLLCQSLPSPPENLNVMPPGLDPSLTTRARFQRHSSDAACSGCHQLIDPVGFGFERYDGVGAYRDTEAGMPIDGSGEVLGLESLDVDRPAAVRRTGPAGRRSSPTAPTPRPASPGSCTVTPAAARPAVATAAPSRSCRRPSPRRAATSSSCSSRC